MEFHRIAVGTIASLAVVSEPTMGIGMESDAKADEKPISLYHCETSIRKYPSDDKTTALDQCPEFRECDGVATFKVYRNADNIFSCMNKDKTKSTLSCDGNAKAVFLKCQGKKSFSRLHFNQKKIIVTKSTMIVAEYTELEKELKGLMKIPEFLDFEQGIVCAAAQKEIRDLKAVEEEQKEELNALTQEQQEVAADMKSFFQRMAAPEDDDELLRQYGISVAEKEPSEPSDDEKLLNNWLAEPEQQE